ncbi:Double-stranded RNA-binding domain [Cinara cedri]|uniref:Double-stranded RNA-binding domain n=1 Tax=Cinara cedri TaxID=506608 RepID=A0A5E4NPB7_9HEMI|nr:Double-stranded RNA-binding domain [Cinara cedri]
MDCLTNILEFDAHKPSTSLLEDLLRIQGVHSIQYDLIKTETDTSYKNRILFKYQVTDGRFIVFGQGDSKREAKEIAAQNFLRILNKEFPELCTDSLFQSHMNDSMVKNNMVEPMTLEDSKNQYRSTCELHKLCASLKYGRPVYVTEEIASLDHSPIYTISCTVLEYKRTGEAKTKKLAKQIAAHKILLILKE